MKWGEGWGVGGGVWGKGGGVLDWFCLLRRNWNIRLGPKCQFSAIAL